VTPIIGCRPNRGLNLSQRYKRE